jgi:alanyl-tRNA synthetase
MLTEAEIRTFVEGVNAEIRRNVEVSVQHLQYDEALDFGAMALFGEKYGEVVRNITIGEPEVFSNELCGGTHVDETGDIGLFLITSEGSAAAGIRRIEAVTGEPAYAFARGRLNTLQETAQMLTVAPPEVPSKLQALQAQLENLEKENAQLRARLAQDAFANQLENVQQVAGVPVLTAIIPGAKAETLRNLADQFRQRYVSGVVVLATVVEDKPLIIAAVTPDLITRGIKAGDLVKRAAAVVGGGGGGKPELAQAGGKDASKLAEALDQVPVYIRETLK